MAKTDAVMMIRDNDETDAVMMIQDNDETDAVMMIRDNNETDAVMMIRDNDALLGKVHDRLRRVRPEREEADARDAGRRLIEHGTQVGDDRLGKLRAERLRNVPGECGCIIHE